MVKKKLEKHPELVDVPLSQIISDRVVSIEKMEDNIKWLTEEIIFKDDQLDREIIEENTSIMYTLMSFPSDNKKPRHVLKIEVEIIKRRRSNNKKTLKIMKELQVEDKKKEEKNASKTG